MLFYIYTHQIASTIFSLFMCLIASLLGLILTVSCSMPLFIQVYEFVGLTDLYYAGSHGMDIMYPVRQSFKNHPNCIRSTDKQVSIFLHHSLCFSPPILS